MDMKLKGKKVIVTGGSRGIGRAALEGFAAEGADVAFFSRNPDQVKETIESLKRAGVNVFGEAFEITDQDSYRAWLLAAAEKLGGVDIFVHNVSSSGGDGTDWNQAFNLDMMCAVTGCNALEPFFEKSEAASVVFMSSTAAVETFFAPNAFNAMKAALINYAKHLSQAWGAKGIRVNVVTPGPVFFPEGNWSKMKEGMADFFAATEQAHALGRMGSPEEVANTIVFLASPAASFTTGTNVIVDGGYTKRVQF